MKEWQAAYDKLKVYLEQTDSERMGKQIKAMVMNQLAEARQKIVQAFRTSQMKVGSKFKAICVKKYEKAKPGEIARKGLKVHSIDTDEGKRDVIYMRVGAKDEWDVEFETLRGAAISETHDDGEIQLRPGQMKSKFDKLAQKNFLDKEALEGIASDAGSNKSADGVEDDSDDCSDKSANESSVEEASRTRCLGHSRVCSTTTMTPNNARHHGKCNRVKLPRDRTHRARSIQRACALGRLIQGEEKRRAPRLSMTLTMAQFV